MVRHHRGEQSEGLAHVAGVAVSGDGGVVGCGISLGHFVEQVVGWGIDASDSPRSEMDGMTRVVAGGAKLDNGEL